GYNYTLRDLGGGFNMFEGAVNVLDYVMEDYMVLANYIKAFENQTVLPSNSPLALKYENFSVDYSNVKGNGRITVVNNDNNDDEDNENNENEPSIPSPSDKGLLTLSVVSCLIFAVISVSVMKKKAR
ncbi:MAG: hypothetical protein J6V36_00225, partial [Clostridia bacterium]|nr:hypothetical protein [Clostridia bacterium]